jgi:hypothetical protein
MPLQEVLDEEHPVHCRSLSTLLESCLGLLPLQRQEQEQALSQQLQLLPEQLLLLALSQSHLQNLSMEAFP